VVNGKCLKERKKERGSFQEPRTLFMWLMSVKVNEGNVMKPVSLYMSMCHSELGEGKRLK
jgi:hypothetical protein